MTQTIITYLIIVGAIVISALKIVKTIRSKKNSPCSGCNGCEIKQEILKNSKDNLFHAPDKCCSGEKENFSFNKIKLDTQNINRLSKQHLSKN